MAKYRQVQISFWQDGFVLTLPPEEKYFYLYLMTNSKTTQCGIYELPLKVIEMETGLSSDRIFELIHKFIKYKKICYNEETREIMMLNWLKHNSLKSPKVRACAEKELQAVKHIPYVTRFKQLSIHYGYSIDSLSIDSGEEEEKEEEQEEEKEGAKPSHNFLMTINKLKLKCRGVWEMEQLESYVGKMEPRLIEEALKRSEHKASVAYAIAILSEWNTKGYTKLDEVQPKQQKKDKPDPELEARRVEIARNKWIQEGNDPDEFEYRPASGH